ncbi:MAG TPA: ArsA-related P-loop ATPase [Propionibacteriaceae bacterium]|nr:ArsA-related P-loop ATPase [Propionibacteriaceae bacterium]
MPDVAPLHIVSGKGGTGKTTVALALALMLRRTGETLVCEVESRHGLSEAAGLSRVALGDERSVTISGQTLRMLSVDSRHALRDYLDGHVRLGVAGALLEKTGFVEFAAELAPGLRDVLLTGKVYQAARRGLKREADAVDAIVMDAPPTGRIESFLTAGEALAEVVVVGPIAPQAQSIMELLRRDSTQVHLVTTCTEMALTETLETIDSLTRDRIAVGNVIVNQVVSAPPPLPDAVTDPALRAAWERDASVSASQRPWAEMLEERLVELGRPAPLRIPLLPREVRPEDLVTIADLLAEGWVA